MWHPICSDGLQSAVRDSINEIARELQAVDTSPLPAFALCEHALLYAYLGLDKASEEWHDKSLGCLNLAIERIPIMPRIHKGLYGGLAGIGWMVQHTYSILTGAEDDFPLQDIVEDDPLFELDMDILDILNNENSFGHKYDLISGYVGIGIYWLERLPRQDALAGIRQTLNALEQLAMSTPLGITWFTPPSLVPPTQIELAPAGYYNLGVAHGVPGVIGFLAQVATLELDKEMTQRASMMLAGAVKWLLAQQRPPDSISRYSCWAMPGQYFDDTRLSWCYGDLGIASVLQFVAELAQNLTWKTEARSLTDRCMLRQLKAEVSDAPLCHGAIGNAHIYNRAYQRYQEDAYRDAALKWINKGLDLRKPGIGVAGYYCWRPDLVPNEQPDASFLTGAVGVALALLSAIAPIEPRWDRIMLLSGVQQVND